MIGIGQGIRREALSQNRSCRQLKNTIYIDQFDPHNSSEDNQRYQIDDLTFLDAVVFRAHVTSFDVTRNDT